MSNSMDLLKFIKVSEEQIDIVNSDFKIAVLEWFTGEYLLNTQFGLTIEELKQITTYMEKLNEN